MRILLKVLAGVVTALYPFLVLWVLYYHREYLSAACLAGMAVLVLAALLRRGGGKRRLVITLVALCILGAVRFSGEAEYLKLYPILVSGMLLFQFGWSLVSPPSMVEQFARLAYRGREFPPEACAYCRRVTWVWVGYFCLNIIISALTALSGSWGLWALYNGCISYIIMGLLFVGEWLVRRRVQARIKS